MRKRHVITGNIPGVEVHVVRSESRHNRWRLRPIPHVVTTGGCDYRTLGSAIDSAKALLRHMEFVIADTGTSK